MALHPNIFANLGFFLSFTFPQIHLNDMITMKDCVINWIRTELIFFNNYSKSMIMTSRKKRRHENKTKNGVFNGG